MNPTAGRFYREICKRLGVTEAGLKVLLRLKSGDNISGGTAGEKLERDGLVTPLLEPTQIAVRRLTEAGLKVCARARALGY
jgi:hypothetical protein